ncbi:MAG: hypothetical protein JWL63_1354 [Rhodocyclales bacterium]|nr:hypothetical protein [Rhodocyclales bacterium]
MPRTLLLALIATAMTTCRPANASAAKSRDNVRKLPLYDRQHETPAKEQTIVPGPGATH